MKTMNTCFYGAHIHPNRHHKTVVLNCGNRSLTELEIYARRYWESGKKLRELNFSETLGHHDVDACPIIFLYRHSAELYLKAIAIESIELRRLEGEEIDRKAELQRILEDQKKNSHRLSRLGAELQRAMKLIGAEWTSDMEYLRSFKEVRKTLEDIDGLDAGSFSFRYPVRIDGMTGSLPPHTTICMDCLCTPLDELLQRLEGIILQIRRIIEERRLSMDDIPTFSDYVSDEYEDVLDSEENQN